VDSYSVSTALLKLQHRDAADTNVSALVDARLVLERLSGDHTRPGEWVNVLGYVTAILPGNPRHDELVVQVQALLVWSAGALDIQQYQASVQSLQRSLDECPPDD
jgi:hypothetical protein